MKTLMINDLAAVAELDGVAMSDIVGGFCGYCPPVWDMPKCDWGMPKQEYGAPNVSFNAAQSLGQSQNTTVNNGNNAAFVSGITANVAPSQNGQNTINFG